MSVFERSEAAQKALNNAVETEQKLLKLKDAVLALEPFNPDFGDSMADLGCWPELRKLREVLRELGVEHT